MVRHKADIIVFPACTPRKPEPDAVRLGHEFGQWCVELFTGERFRRWISLDSLDRARTEVSRLQDEGLRRLPPSNQAMVAGGGR